MKVLIGITQDLNSTKDDLTLNFRGLGTSTEVGPFKTREEAENWKEFMINRRENYEEIQSQISIHKDARWFGFTFENPVVH